MNFWRSKMKIIFLIFNLPKRFLSFILKSLWLIISESVSLLFYWFVLLFLELYFHSATSLYFQVCFLISKEIPGVRYMIRDHWNRACLARQCREWLVLCLPMCPFNLWLLQNRFGLFFFLFRVFSFLGSRVLLAAHSRACGWVTKIQVYDDLCLMFLDMNRLIGLDQALLQAS